jgi:DNA polymerase-3 subunit alpha
VEEKIMSTDFAHLHVHTEYSLLDGLSRISTLVQQAKAYGMKHLAITDHGAMYGIPEFYLECKKAGIHPVLGQEAYICEDMDVRSGKSNAYNHLVILSKNLTGYQNLCRMTTEAYTRGLYYGKPRMDKKLLEKYSEGLIVTSSCLGGEIPELLVKKQDVEGAKRAIRWYQNTFGPENFFLEFQEHYGKDSPQGELNQQLYQLQKEMQLQSIITNDLHYVHKDQSILHDIFLCIQMNNQLEEEKRFRFDSEEYYLKTPEEMSHLYPELPEALMNTVRLAEMCDVDPTSLKGGLPDFVLPAGFTADHEYLQYLSYEGAKERFGELSERVKTQLDYELSLIRQKGFSSYFLIEWDFVNYARSRGIRCLARGSAAGSVLAYTLGITNVDPLRYQLLFERFMNPERNDMPDIDMDFPDDRREEVINYVIQKYGADHVAQMVTFNTLGAKMAVKDVARTRGWQQLADQVNKLLDKADSIEDGIKANPDLRRLYEENSQAKTLLDNAKGMEGYIRNTGVHAAGLVISKNRLDDVVPLFLRDPKNPEAGRIIQFEQKYYEDQFGLIKYDFLGLMNLSLIDTTLKFIKAIHNEDLLLEKLPLDPCDDPEKNRMRQNAFDLLARGDTVEVFQLESPKMREYIKAMVALYRPGPMDSIPDFINAKHGRKKIEYLDPRMSEWLAESYGVIVYQDQVLQIAVNLAGFSWGKVNKFRKALSKKIMTEVEGYKGSFIEGCVNSGLKKETAQELFTRILPFGGYGFNKAHAASYAVVAYYTAYLKANYAPEYMAASMTAELGDAKQVAVLIAECKRMGVDVLPPDVNQSLTGFSVEDGNVRFGLMAIKGVGEQPCQEIIAARNTGGPFRDLADYATRVSGKSGGKSMMELLVKSGAMDSMGERAKLLGSIDQALQWGKNQKKIQLTGQMDMWGLEMIQEDDATAITFSLNLDAPEFGRKQLLDWEKEFLGVYLSPHPLTYLSHIFENKTTHAIVDILPESNKEKVVIGGIIKEVRKFQTKKGDPMCTLLLEDIQATISVTIFPRAYENYKAICETERTVILKGVVQHNEDRDEISILCDSLEEVEAVEQEVNRIHHTAWLSINISGSSAKAVSDDLMKVHSLKEVLRKYPGYDQYEIAIAGPEWRTSFTIPENTFEYTPRVHRELVRILGNESCIEVIAQQ